MDCAWNEEIPPIVEHIVRKWRMIQVGITLLSSDLTQWETTALIIADEAIEAERSKRRKKE